MIRAFFQAALLLAVVSGRLEAQVVDTTRADSLARDTTDYTARFLKAQLEAKRLIPTMPRVGSAALLPPLTRLVIDRDSIIWHGAETVSDLLTKLPGVFLLRGGWAGRPELPAYQAHGATSVSYVLDGIPFIPLGQDSVMVDPSLFPISFIDRVEVERTPGQLRVWLFTRRNDRNVPYSMIGIASGDLQIARYQGQLQKRSAKGPGFAVAFDHFAVPVQDDEAGAYANLQGWLRLDYVRSDRFGAEIQFFRNAPDREPVLSSDATADTLSRARHGARHDLSARVFAAPGGTHGSGPRIDLLASRSSWTDEIEKDSTQVITEVLDSLGVVIGEDTTYEIAKHRSGISQLGAVAAYRLPSASLEGSVFWRSSRTPIDLRVRAAVAPLERVSLGLDAVYQRHEGSRTSRWVTARAGLRLPLGFTAGATWRVGDEVMLPAIRADAAQSVDDRSVTLAWRKAFAELEGSFTTNAAFRPTGYLQFPAVVNIGPSGRTDWLTLRGRLSPRQWLDLGGWFNTPLAGHPEGQPPRHMLLHIAIQSKFLPTFRSGIFNLKMQVSVERWAAGVLGQDSTGTAATLAPATYYRGYLGLQIGPFVVYYDRYNMQASQGAYVPGLPIPAFAQTFGVRWEFAN